MKSDNKLMDIVLKIYEKIEQVNEKLDGRIVSAEEKHAVVESRLKVYNSLLEQNDLNLQNHMLRTTQLEMVILKHQQYVSNVQFAISILGAVATVVAIYVSLSSL